MINVTIGESKTQEKPFPKVMKDENGDIFFFVREKYGLPLTDFKNEVLSFDNENFADFSSNYRKFTDFKGSITLQNQ